MMHAVAALAALREQFSIARMNKHGLSNLTNKIQDHGNNCNADDDADWKSLSVILKTAKKILQAH